MPPLCSQTMEFWEYCFSECPLFGNHGILGVLFFRMPPVRKPWNFGSTVFQNAPCLEIMAFWEYCKWKPAKLGYNVKIPPFSSGLFRRCRPRDSKICPRTASSPESLGKRWYFGPKLTSSPRFVSRGAASLSVLFLFVARE